MIKENTVFILGAGASCPYGFPDGKSLVNLIVDGIKINHVSPFEKNNPMFMTDLKQASGEHPNKEAESLEAFRLSLMDSRELSVDAFLEHHQHFIPIGKRVIAAILLEYEKTSLDSSPREGDWYRQLSRMLNTPEISQFSENKVGIITFNYDRSFEEYFIRSFRGRDMAILPAGSWNRKLYETIPIVHLHGKLGSHKRFMGKDEDHYIPYGGVESGSPPMHGMIRTAADNIRIVHESINLDNDPEFNRAYKLLQTAKYVCFLGFGYDPTNLKRLRLKENLRPDAIVTGSAYGMAPAEIKQITRKTDGKMLPENGRRSGMALRIIY